MRNTFTRRETRFAVACALALGAAGTAGAQYVAPASTPAPAPAVMGTAGPLPVWEKVALDATVQFDSDKSALLPAGRDTLDQFVADIRGLDSQSIRATGYAERMGTHAANQILSQERVDAVKAYLVGKGIAADRVQTSAMGETRPSMQPDRHVFIEVSGTRIAK